MSDGIGEAAYNLAKSVKADYVNSKQYIFPFQRNATLLISGDTVGSQALKTGIVGIKLTGANPSKNYSITNFQRKFGASVVSTINIWETGSYTLVAAWYQTNYKENAGIDTLTLEAANNSGITGKVYVDWSKFPSSCKYDPLDYGAWGIDRGCYIGNLTTDLNARVKSGKIKRHTITATAK